MDTDRLPVRLLLPDHHRRLDAKCEGLLDCAYANDARSLVTRWRELEPELRDHMAEEEATILPDFAVFAPQAAAQILAEHVRIRSLFEIVGVDIEHHEMRLSDVRELVVLLRVHAEREDRCMYPWAQRHLARSTEHSLFVRVCGWFGLAVDAVTVPGKPEAA